MSETLTWWFVMQVVGLAALPLCLSLFRNLPDRGYSLSKAFGLIILGYLFWVLNVMRIMPNTTGGIWLTLFLVMIASGILLWRRRTLLERLVRERMRLILITEVVLFLAFITAVWLRSFVPDLGGTEKPMDFMFLNATTHGKGFPPDDPWLAGHSVSYYYFGYLLVSILTRLSGLSTGIGFNLGVATIAALGVTGAFGIVYNLTAPRERAIAEGGPGTPGGNFSRPLGRPVVFGLIAALMLAVMGNLEGVLEALASKGVGGEGFYTWVNVLNLSQYESTRWFPDPQQGFWFWWRATRMLDAGTGIHEFPFFSFLLGDLHPHVMSIPFVLLAVGVALNFFRSDEPLDVVVWLERPLWLVAFSIVLGGLAFLNTWDLPTMAFLVALAALLRNTIVAGKPSWGVALDTAGFVLPVFLLGALAYTPFFFGGFDSQASGFTAEASNGSGLFHTFLIWGTFAAIVVPYAVWRISRSEAGVTREAVLWALAPAAAVFFLWLVWDGLASALGWLPRGVRINDAHIVGNSGVEVSFGDRLSERGWNWLTPLVMGGALGILVLALIREVEGAYREREARTGHVFALGLAATAALLIFGTEFVYIEDTFNSRMNTIFKLYYQAWILLSLAGGFALYELSRAIRLPVPRPDLAVRWSPADVFVAGATLLGFIVGAMIGNGNFLTAVLTGFILGGVFFVVGGGFALLWGRPEPKEGEEPPSGVLSWRGIWAGAASVVLVAGFVYPLLATYNRTDAFDLPRGLNGLDYYNGDDRAAVECLQGVGGHPVIAEALGGDYTPFGRISAATGLSTVLEWPGHQLQWRGDSEAQTGRPEDLQTLYTSSDAQAVRGVLDKYKIRYVIVGSMEQEAYQPVTVGEMTDIFEPVTSCTLGVTQVYRVRPGTIQSQLSAE